jgi:hypothetical protein
MIKNAGPAGTAPAHPWSFPVTVERIPDEGLHCDIEAPAEARTGIAALAGVREVSALSASFDLARDGASVHVSGRVRGRVGQNCVVTLKPVDTDIDEAVEVTFAPPPAEASARAPSRRNPPGNAAEEPPEPLVGATLDLGAIAVEFLILGIDPYPRKPGVEFTPPSLENDDPHPFSALAALKNGPIDGKT